MKNSWNEEDRQRFADRNILRAQRIPDKKKDNNRKECRKWKWNNQ